MTPIKTSEKDGVINFHYKFSDLRYFISEGLKHGNVGMLVIKAYPDRTVWKGFGTFENPIRHINTMTVMNSPLFSGEKQMSGYLSVESPVQSTGFIILDTNQ